MLKEPPVEEAFYNDMETMDRESSSVEGIVERMGQILKVGLRKTADDICGETKDQSRHEITSWWNEEVFTE